MRLATRRSALALAQAELVSRELGGCELVEVTTAGDRGAPAQDKSRWVDELERALLDGRADLAVHSAKDLPGELADGPGARRRTGAGGARGRALRRRGDRGAAAPGAGWNEQHQAPRAAARRPRGPRGDRAARQRRHPSGAAGGSRLRPAGDRAGACRAARASAREQSAGGSLDPARFVPAPGQGTLALEGRAGDEQAVSAARAITDAATLASLLAERALARELDADCHTPLGACALPCGEGELHLRAWVGLPDGSVWARRRAAEGPIGGSSGAGAARSRGACGRRGGIAAGAGRSRWRARERAESGAAGRARVPRGGGARGPRPDERPRARADLARRRDPVRPPDPRRSARRRPRRRRAGVRGQGGRRELGRPAADRGADARARACRALGGAPEGGRPVRVRTRRRGGARAARGRHPLRGRAGRDRRDRGTGLRRDPGDPAGRGQRGGARHRPRGPVQARAATSTGRRSRPSPGRSCCTWGSPASARSRRR